MITNKNIYLIYSSRDQNLANELKKSLVSLKREKLVLNIWDRSEIQAGKNILDEVSDKIKKSDIVLLLISSDFIASKKCYDKDMKIAFEHLKKTKKHIIPILIRECSWENSEIALYNILPKNFKPIKSSHWENIDSPLKEIVDSIRELILKINDSKKQNLSIKNEEAIFIKEYELGAGFMESELWQKAIERLELAFFHFHPNYSTDLKTLTNKIVHCNKEIGFLQKKELAMKDYEVGNLKQAYELSLMALKIKESEELENIKNEYLKSKKGSKRKKRIISLVGLTILIFLIKPYFFINQTLIDNYSESIRNDIQLNITNENKKIIRNSWEMAQCAVAMGELNENEKTHFLKYINTEKRGCLCWKEEEEDNCECHFGATGWVLRAMATHSIPIDDSILNNVLDNQNKEGAWSITGLKDEKYGSTYATCLLLLSLNLVQHTKPTDLKIKIKSAIKSGESWLYYTSNKDKQWKNLLKNNKGKVYPKHQWKDYPKHNKGKVYRSVTALAVHTLNTLNNEDLKLSEIKSSWMSTLSNYVYPEGRFDERSIILYLNNGKTIFKDETWHLIEPWEIIATIDAFQDGNFVEKRLAFKHINRILKNIKIDESDFEDNGFIQAEYLLSLRLLKEFNSYSLW